MGNARKTNVNTIDDHVYYPVRGRESRCFTCGVGPSEHNRTYVDVQAKYDKKRYTSH